MLHQFNTISTYERFAGIFYFQIVRNILCSGIKVSQFQLTLAFLPCFPILVKSAKTSSVNLCLLNPFHLFLHQSGCIAPTLVCFQMLIHSSHRPPQCQSAKALASLSSLAFKGSPKGLLKPGLFSRNPGPDLPYTCTTQLNSPTLSPFHLHSFSRICYPPY